MKHNAIESEAIGLCVALEALDEIANKVLFGVRPTLNSPHLSEAHFKSLEHQELFFIRLLDFSKEKSRRSFLGFEGSCLTALLKAGETKSFDSNGSVSSLREASQALEEWLQASAEIKLWLPSLQVEGVLEIPRVDLVFIFGNSAKHNLGRLSGVCQKVANLLTVQGNQIEEEWIPLALNEFRNQIQMDHFVYWGTWLAELVNNLRWGIQKYLTPVYQESFVQDPENTARYKYLFPSGIQSELGQAWFHRLMNNVRLGPFMDPFLAPGWMKKEPFHNA